MKHILTTLTIFFISFGAFAQSDIESLQQLAATGDINAMNSLAWRYANGQGIKKNIRKAIEWYEEAANAGDASAMMALGVYYENGDGVQQDYYKALSYYKQALQYGNMAALYTIGNFYYRGNAVPQDRVKANLLYSASDAVDRGDMKKAMEYLAEVFPDMSSFSAYAKRYVEEKINTWQKKGEFEKTDSWKERVNDVTRNKKIEELTRLAEAEYITKFAPKNHLRLTLDDYDADNETFKVNDPKYGDMLVAVPIDVAPDFKSSWASITYEPKYFIENDRLSIASLSFRMPDGHTFKYSNNASLNYTIAQVNYNFDPIEIDVDDSREINKGRQKIGVKNIDVGKSDVDLNIPVSSELNNHTFAVIIANEKYSKLAPVEYAINDSKVFKEYCNKTLGLPKENIRLYQNATLGTMFEAINDIKTISNAFKGNIKVIFYYAGHGAPDESNSKAYIMPTDAYAVNSRTCYALEDFYADLNKIDAKSIVVFMDACFSGATRSGDMLASARAVAISTRRTAPKGNVVVFSAASSSETAYPYRDKGHGMFTYYLLKKLQETEGEVNLGELGEYIKSSVMKQSSVVNRKIQTPTVMTSDSFYNDWKKIKLK